MPGVFMHQLIDGALAETGTRLSGLRASLVEDRQPLTWVSGDVHRPQQLACGLTYVGSPYGIDFGDDFEPRVLLIGNTVINLHFPCLRKWTLRVRGTDQLPTGPKAGDHVKIVASLSREEVVEWAAIKRKLLDACREMEVQVFNIELEITDDKKKWADSQPVKNKIPGEIFKAFCQAEKLGPVIKEAGQMILEG